MSLVLRPLYISFYATNVFKANGYKKIEYILIFISCQPLSYYTELIGSIFLKLYHSSLSMTSTFSSVFFLLFITLLLFV